MFLMSLGSLYDKCYDLWAAQRNHKQSNQGLPLNVMKSSSNHVVQGLYMKEGVLFGGTDYIHTFPVAYSLR